MREFRNGGDEYAAPPEYSIPRGGEFPPPPTEGYGKELPPGAPEEFSAPPEFTSPGLSAAAQKTKKKKQRSFQKRLIYMILSASLVLTAVGPFRLFSGKGDAADALLPGAQAVTVSPVGPEQLSAPVPETRLTPAPSPAAAPGEEVSETSAPHETPVFSVPDCEIYVTNFYSEFRGKLIFHDMDSAEAVTLELWDPETDSCDASRDITEEALAAGEYDLAPFSTDFVYEKHREYYEEKNAFPMQLLIRVLVDYQSETGLTQAVFSALSMSEVGWEAVYVSSDREARGEWINPGCFQVQVKDCPAAYEIIYGKGEPESPNHLFVQMQIDGRSVRIDPAKLVSLHDEYDAETIGDDGEWVAHHYHTTLLVIPMPDGYAENEGHTATFTVVQYLTNAETAVAFEEEVEF